VAGTLALVGSGEFPDVMRPIDAGLLARVRQTGRAHVVALGVSVDVILIGAGARR
jgi:hypothetical protein